MHGICLKLRLRNQAPGQYLHIQKKGLRLARCTQGLVDVQARHHECHTGCKVSEGGVKDEPVDGLVERIAKAEGADDEDAPHKRERGAHLLDDVEDRDLVPRESSHGGRKSASTTSSTQMENHRSSPGKLKPTARGPHVIKSICTGRGVRRVQAPATRGSRKSESMLPMRQDEVGSERPPWPLTCADTRRENYGEGAVPSSGRG